MADISTVEGAERPAGDTAEPNSLGLSLGPRNALEPNAPPMSFPPSTHDLPSLLARTGTPDGYNDEVLMFQALPIQPLSTTRRGLESTFTSLRPNTASHSTTSTHAVTSVATVQGNSDVPTFALPASSRDTSSAHSPTGSVADGQSSDLHSSAVTASSSYPSRTYSAQKVESAKLLSRRATMATALVQVGEPSRGLNHCVAEPAMNRQDPEPLTSPRTRLNSDDR